MNDLTRYERIVDRPGRSALAYTATAIRLEIAAREAPFPGVATKLRDRDRARDLRAGLHGRITCSYGEVAYAKSLTTVGCRRAA